MCGAAMPPLFDQKPQFLAGGHALLLPTHSLSPAFTQHLRKLPLRHAEAFPPRFLQRLRTPQSVMLLFAPLRPCLCSGGAPHTPYPTPRPFACICRGCRQRGMEQLPPAYCNNRPPRCATPRTAHSMLTTLLSCALPPSHPQPNTGLPLRLRRGDARRHACTFTTTATDTK